MTGDRKPGAAKPFEDGALESRMRAAQQGDQGAYAGLLDRIAPWLRRYIRNQRPFLQAADVEDILQDVLLSLHAVRHTYDPGRPFLPWLLAIAHNRLTDAARRHTRRAVRETAVGAFGGGRVRGVTSWDEPSNTENGDVVAEDDLLGDSRALARAIRALPARQRTAVDLLKLREMSLKEAARVSGASEGALKVSVHRAMASLRRTLGRKNRKE